MMPRYFVQRFANFSIGAGDRPSSPSSADPSAPGHGQQSRLQSARQDAQGSSNELHVERFFPSCGLSEFRGNGGVLLGLHSNRRPDRWSFTQATDGRMVPLQRDENTGF